MASYVNQKKAIKNQILEAVDKAGSLDKEKLIAELCLNTGFTDKTIKKLISQMAQLNYIYLDGLMITRPKTTQPGAVIP